MRKFLVIDGNNIIYSVQHASKRLSAGEVEVTAVFGFLNALRNWQTKWPDATPIVLWDSTPNWRVDVYPEYKGNRKENKQLLEIAARLRPQRPILEQMLRDLGIKQYKVDKMEADDLAADLSRKLVQKNAEVVLITRDGDWQQLVNNHVSWYDHKKEILLTPENFHEVTGFKDPAHFVEGKVIMGDGGDNVPGLGGLGEGAATIIMSEFTSMQDLADRWAVFEPTIEKGSKWSRYYKAPVNKALADPKLWERYAQNQLLMNLVDHQYPEIQYRSDSVYDADALKASFGKYGFHSMLAKYDHWVAPFHH